MSNQKNDLINFLNLAADYLQDGHSRHSEVTVQEDKPDLPLAYLIDEDEEPVDSCDSRESLEVVAAEITACKACVLAETRTLAVPGEGSERPLVMVIGEGPGADEDRAGRPFVGRAGQLLDKMLASIGLFREENCFIANMVKCRPPGNRDPDPREMAACFSFLKRQILLLQPRLILCAGRVSAQSLLKTSQGINTLRGKFVDLEVGEIVIPVLPTFHPSAILRDESLKRPAWEDLKLLKSHLDSFESNDKE